jgi:hypothetical protein
VGGLGHFNPINRQLPDYSAGGDELLVAARFDACNPAWYDAPHIN